MINLLFLPSLPPYQPLGYLVVSDEVDLPDPGGKAVQGTEGEAGGGGREGGREGGWVRMWVNKAVQGTEGEADWGGGRVSQGRRTRMISKAICREGRKEGGREGGREDVPELVAVPVAIFGHVVIPGFLLLCLEGRKEVSSDGGGGRGGGGGGGGGGVGVCHRRSSIPFRLHR